MARRSALEHRNVLPNTYIPVLSGKTQAAVLNRLPRTSLLELMSLWIKLLNTQPHTSDSKTKQERRRFLRNMSTEVEMLKGGEKKVSKKKIIDKILFEYWTKGLNLLQLSQIDCQLIVERQNSHLWILSKVIDVHGKDVPIILDAPKFLAQLSKELNLLYMTYIYVCRHPKMPMYLVRIQVFDLEAIKVSKVSNHPHIASHRPFFLSLPFNSPFIIHSIGNDLVSNIILQSVEQSLLSALRFLVKLKTSSSQKPVRSLESMHILHGCSRFRRSLGIWTPYADGVVDMSPISSVDEHSIMNSAHVLEPQAIDKDEALANLRFKGNAQGQVKSSKLYEDVVVLKCPGRGRKRSSRTEDWQDISFHEETSEEEEDQDGEEKSIKKTRYSSIAPLQYSEFIIEEIIDTREMPEPIVETHEEYRSSIRLKLVGTDIFAGMHELCTKKSRNNEKYVNVTSLPGWLTGEEGVTFGKVKNSALYRNERT